MSVIENNKLIAEFMGYKQDANGKYEIIEDFDIVENIQTYVEDDDYRTVEGGIVLVNFLPEEMRFHISWDWLMPVVEKIECTTIDGTDNSDNFFNVVIEVFECNINGGDVTICEQGHTKREGTYKAVVEFIKWYNQNK